MMSMHQWWNSNDRLPDGFSDALKDMGFKCIGSGATREAFSNGSLVVKMGNLRANTNEWNAFQKYNNHPIFSQLIIPMYGMHGHLRHDTFDLL
jgi:hypothetical protein